MGAIIVGRSDEKKGMFPKTRVEGVHGADRWPCLKTILGGDGVTVNRRHGIFLFPVGWEKNQIELFWQGRDAPISVFIYLVFFFFFFVGCVD